MTFIITTEKVRNNAIKHLLSLPLNVWQMDVKKISKSRQQEKYWHKLVGIIANHVGEDKEEFKMQLKYEWLHLHEVKTRNGDTYLYPESTAKLSKDKYAELITKTLALGMDLGLVMPRPEDLGMKF